MLKSNNSGEGNTLWLSTPREIIKTSFYPIDGEESREKIENLAGLNAKTQYTEDDYKLDSVWTVAAGHQKEETETIWKNDGYLKYLGTKRKNITDKKNVYGLYISKHPYTSEIARRMIFNSNDKSRRLIYNPVAINMPIRLINLMGDSEASKLIMSLPRKTPNDYKRINKMVELYYNDYNSFLDLLPYLNFEEEATYEKEELETLKRLNAKNGFIGSEETVLARNIIGRENTQIMKLSYRLLEN